MTTTTTQPPMMPTQPTVEQVLAGMAAQVRTSAVRRHIRALRRAFGLVRGLRWVRNQRKRVGTRLAGPLPFHLGWWAFTFPLGADTVATMTLAQSWPPSLRVSRCSCT